jgi:hypothetical protein
MCWTLLPLTRQQGMPSVFARKFCGGLYCDMLSGTTQAVAQLLCFLLLQTAADSRPCSYPPALELPSLLLLNHSIQFCQLRLAVGNHAVQSSIRQLDSFHLSNIYPFSHGVVPQSVL